MILAGTILCALVVALVVALLLLYYYARGLELTVADLRKDARPHDATYSLEITSLRYQLDCARRQVNEVTARYTALCNVMAELTGLRPQLEAMLALGTTNSRTESALRNFMIVTGGSTTASNTSTAETAQEATKDTAGEGGDSVSLIMRKVRRSNVQERQ